MSEGSEGDHGGVDRRQFIQRSSAVAAATIALPGVLSACGGDDSSDSDSAKTTSETPGKGGTLRIGFLGNGSSETFNPAICNSYIDALHVYSVYSTLIRAAPGYKTEPGLALEWNPNSGGTVWELKLRDGVVWQDGKPFTADDVIYTLRQMGDPAHFGHPFVKDIQLRDLKKLDDHTLRVPLSTPVGRLYDLFLTYSTAIVQDGAKTDGPTHIGTGPYKLDSFSPGKRAVLTANRDYWEESKPYPDRLEIISIDDDTARLNALLGGEIDVCSPLNYVQAKAGGAFNKVVGHGGNAIAFGMRTDSGPYKDVRVRRAMRMLADRQGIADSAYNGFAFLGNDLLSKGVELYASDLPQREQDVEQAKSLLKAAGAADETFVLQTSPVNAGLVEAATAFAEQANSAGVNVKVKRELPASYFNPSLLFLKMNFAQDVWPPFPLSSIYAQTLVTNGPSNETHWNSASYDKLVAEASGAVDEDEAKSLWADAQKIQYDSGGYMIPVFAQDVTAVSKAVRGMGGEGAGWLWNLDDLRVWNWGLSG